MIRLRLQRHGSKKRPVYRIVAADQRAPRDGRFRELLGTYDPRRTPIMVNLKMDRVDYWLGVGAQPTQTVTDLIRKVRAGEGVTTDKLAETAREALKAQRDAALAVKAVPAKEEAPAAEAAPEAAAAEGDAAEGDAAEAADAPAEEAAEAPAAEGDDSAEKAE